MRMESSGMEIRILAINLGNRLRRQRAGSVNVHIAGWMLPHFGENPTNQGFQVFSENKALRLFIAQRRSNAWRIAVSAALGSFNSFIDLMEKPSRNRVRQIDVIQVLARNNIHLLRADH